MDVYMCMAVSVYRCVCLISVSECVSVYRCVCSDAHYLQSKLFFLIGRQPSIEVVKDVEVSLLRD